MKPRAVVSNGETSYSIASNDQLFEAKDYKPLIVAQRNGIPVPLGSIANVLDAQENDQQAGWTGPHRAVLLAVTKQAGANVLKITDQINAMLPQLERWLAPRREGRRARRPHADHPRVGQRRAVHAACSASRWSSW